MKLMTLLCATAALTAVTLSAKADVLIGNYPILNDLNPTAFSGTIPGLLPRKAAGFTLPSGADYELDSAVLRLRASSTAVQARLKVYGDGGGVPVAPELAILTTTPLVLGTVDYTFTPLSPFVLEDATTYWLVLEVDTPSGSKLDWFASTPSKTPTGIATTAGYRIGGSGLPSSVSNILNTYQVNATPIVVPEPGAMGLMGLGVVSVVSCAMRRRRPDAGR